MGSPASDVKYRFQWTFPILLSPHDPGVLYVTGNHVFRSTDEGASWEEISPDLTRHDAEHAWPLGRADHWRQHRHRILCHHLRLRRVAASRRACSGLAPTTAWSTSRATAAPPGRTSPRPDLPEWALISIIEPSPHDPATAYVAATRYKLDDFHPYLYKTNDYGATWTKITDGIADNDFTRVIREDPERRGLLFAGTETGVYVSFDDGAHWQPLQLNLPAVPIHDLIIKEGDLIAATHGRAFWVLDDIGPLRQMTDDGA